MRKSSKTIYTAATLSGAMILSVSSVLAQAPPSVPRMVSFQAEVTDPGGNPIADGVYPATFEIFNVSAGGVAIWTEIAPAVPVSGSVFTHNLGSIAPLPQYVETYDELWLEVTFDGELQTPRIRFVSTPYSQLAGSLEMRNLSSLGDNALETDQFSHRLSQFGADGGEQIRLWGVGWGELVLNDGDYGDGSDEVQLSSNNGSGGLLELRKAGGLNGVTLHGGGVSGGATLALTNDAGSTTIAMNGDQSGNAAVQVPAGSISDIECLNEPGVASDVVAGANPLGVLQENLGSRTITCPSAGYVLAIGSCGASANHVNGTQDRAIFGVSTAAVGFPASQDIEFNIPSSAPTGAYEVPVAVQTIFSVASGANTFYFNAAETIGDVTVNNATLSLLFVATDYGTVDPPAPPGGSEDLTSTEEPSGDAERANAAEFDAARLLRELAIVRAQSEETTRQLAELRAMMPTQQPVAIEAKPEN